MFNHEELEPLIKARYELDQKLRLHLVEWAKQYGKEVVNVMDSILRDRWDIVEKNVRSQRISTDEAMMVIDQLAHFKFISEEQFDYRATQFRDLAPLGFRANIIGPGSSALAIIVTTGVKYIGIAGVRAFVTVRALPDLTTWLKTQHDSKLNREWELSFMRISHIRTGLEVEASEVERSVDLPELMVEEIGSGPYRFVLIDNKPLPKFKIFRNTLIEPGVETKFQTYLSLNTFEEIGIGKTLYFGLRKHLNDES